MEFAAERWTRVMTAAEDSALVSVLRPVAGWHWHANDWRDLPVEPHLRTETIQRLRNGTRAGGP
jgi:hypothetical protein